jgi:hypothetical protein
MAAFPTVKTLESIGFADQPGSSRPQIHIFATHHTYEFDAIPDVGVWHAVTTAWGGGGT